MTDDGRAATNRTNAQRSTGPRTAVGKATAAQNARRHGVTGKPDPASVATWVRVILDDPDLTPAALLAEDDRVRLALALAVAEVKFCAALSSLDRFERGDEAPSEITCEFQGFFETITDELADERMTMRQHSDGLSLLKRLENAILTETALDGTRHRLLRRYLHEARSQRRRAFNAWLAGLGVEKNEMRGQRKTCDLPKQSQITPIGCISP